MATVSNNNANIKVEQMDPDLPAAALTPGGKGKEANRPSKLQTVGATPNADGGGNLSDHLNQSHTQEEISHQDAHSEHPHDADEQKEESETPMTALPDVSSIFKFDFQSLQDVMEGF